jgi:hypothetical protein
MSEKPSAEWFARIGKRGGLARGASKVRGDPDYYRDLARRSAEVRKRKRIEGETKNETVQ